MAANSNIFDHSADTSLMRERIEMTYVKTAEHKENLRKANLGKKRTPETCEKIRLAKLGVPNPKGRKPKPTSTCPHCMKTVANNMYARFHGKNCKQRPINDTISSSTE